MIATRVVAKTMVFDDQGRLLVLTRSPDDDHRPDGYDLPGGAIDAGESYAEGAAREALEEADLTLHPDDLQAVFATSYSGKRPENGDYINVVWLGYATRLPRGQTVRLSHEHQAYRWLDWPEAAQLVDSDNLIAFVGHMQASGLYHQFTEPVVAI